MYNTLPPPGDKFDYKDNPHNLNIHVYVGLHVCVCKGESVTQCMTVAL